MSALDNFFKLTERGSTLLTEFRAGTATFVTLCYILAGSSDRNKLSACLPTADLLRLIAFHTYFRIRFALAPQSTPGF